MPKNIKPYKGIAMESVIARWYGKNRGAAPEPSFAYPKNN